jgi:hypothetical protein
MDVSVDGKRDFVLQGDPKDVLSAIAAVSDFLRTQGRALLSVHVDGTEVPAEKLVETFEDKPLADVESLDIKSADVAALAKDMLDEVREAVAELPKACHELAQVFHGDKPEEGFEPFQHLADIWGSVKQREALIIGATGMDESNLMIGGRKTADHHQELNRFLGECASAIEKNDCVTLGDLLEYELAPRAEVEMEIFSKLEEACSKSSG